MQLMLHAHHSNDGVSIQMLTMCRARSMPTFELYSRSREPCVACDIKTHKLMTVRSPSHQTTFMILFMT